MGTTSMNHARRGGTWCIRLSEVGGRASVAASVARKAGMRRSVRRSADMMAGTPALAATAAVQRRTERRCSSCGCRGKMWENRGDVRKICANKLRVWRRDKS